MKKVDDISEGFLNLEKKLNLFEYRFSNILIWDYIRYGIYLEIKKKTSKDTVAKTSLKSSLFKSIFLLLKSFFDFLINFSCYKVSLDKDIIFLGHPRKVFEDSHYIDKYCNEIIEELHKEFSVKTLDLPFRLKHYKNEGVIDSKYLDVYEYLMIFAPYLVRTRLTEEEENFMEKIKSEIEKEFLVDINVSSHVKKGLKQYKILQKRIDKLFVKNTPKCLICVDGYDFIKKLFIEKANKHSIPTIELQHGAVGYFHIAYRYHKLENPLYSFPKCFFIWGEHWDKYLLLPEGKFSKVVGFPYLEKRVLAKKSTEKNILVISQWTIGFELIKKVNELAEQLPEYNFLFKLHPNEIDEFGRYKSSIKAENISIVGNEIGLYDLFNKSIAQIGVYSTALIEGLAFNLPTFIVPINGHNVFAEFINERIMIKLTSFDDIVNELESKISSTYTKNKVWHEEALANNIREIKLIVQNH
ncbi:hypothetical protein [Pseudotenacibaculum haliotis]|uniref:Uncharacterized protein n=1 Tax=Pseudotenacibaculum haliotis TaxID=1862138 RepID=A0ABW5LVI5_9FLAO